MYVPCPVVIGAEVLTVCDAVYFEHPVIPMDLLCRFVIIPYPHTRRINSKLEFAGEFTQFFFISMIRFVAGAHIGSVG